MSKRCAACDRRIGQASLFCSDLCDAIDSARSALQRALVPQAQLELDGKQPLVEQARARLVDLESLRHFIPCHTPGTVHLCRHNEALMLCGAEPVEGVLPVVPLPLSPVAALVPADRDPFCVACVNAWSAQWTATLPRTAVTLEDWE